MMGGFSWCEFRALDVDAALRFYEAVVGLRSEGAGEGTVVSWRGEPLGAVVTLPARARELGAPAHWLHHFSTPDVDALAATMGERLGPPRVVDGHRVVGVRDRDGAVVALTSRPFDANRKGFDWVEQYSLDPAASRQWYADAFGWRVHAATGSALPFGWGDETSARGAMMSRAGRPEVHAQWLSYFAVDDLDRALAEVRARGGVVAGEWAAREGWPRGAACDDPQGAAFGLRQRAG